MTSAVNQCHFFLRCDFFKHLTSIHCGPEIAQCIWNFRSNCLNVYKVSRRKPAMYMEFWFALANVYRVLLATIEHPLPLSWTPQDGVWFLRTWWQAPFLFAATFSSKHFWPSATLSLKVCEVWDLNLALQAGAKAWWVVRRVVTQTVVFEKIVQANRNWVERSVLNGSTHDRYWSQLSNSLTSA